MFATLLLLPWCYSGNLITLGLKNEIVFQANFTNSFADILISTTIRNGWVAIGFGSSLVDADIWMLSKFPNTNWTFEARQSEHILSFNNVKNNVSFRRTLNNFNIDSEYLVFIYAVHNDGVNSQRGLFKYRVNHKSRTNYLRVTSMLILWFILSYFRSFLRYTKAILPKFYPIFAIILSFSVIGLSYLGTYTKLISSGKWGLLFLGCIFGQIIAEVVFHRLFQVARIRLRKKFSFWIETILCSLGIFCVLLDENYHDALNSMLFCGTLLLGFFVFLLLCKKQKFIFSKIVK